LWRTSVRQAYHGGQLPEGHAFIVAAKRVFGEELKHKGNAHQKGEER
jgi:hypothetical protein